MPNNFLTKEGYQKLQEELDYLRTAKRQEVANRLHEAMEGGELIENAEYEAAKERQDIRDNIERVEDVDQSENNGCNRSVKRLAISACPPILDECRQNFAIFDKSL